MTRLLRVLFCSLVVLCLTASPALASRQLDSRLLGQLWTYVLETEPANNPYLDGDHCVRLGTVLAPFQSTPPPDAPTLTCTVEEGTKVLVTAYTWECSTVESGDSYGGTPAELRACARKGLRGASDLRLRVDGRSVDLRKVETRLLHLELPSPNILGVEETTADSVGAAKLALLRHLRPGTHHIAISWVDATGPHEVPTTIVVERRQ